MLKFLKSFIFWLIFWVGGWIFLRTVPGGLDLLDRELFLTANLPFVLVVNLFILIATFLTLFFFRLLFGPEALFNLRSYKLNTALLTLICLTSIFTPLYIIFLTDVEVKRLLFGFLIATSYYLCVTLFQQVINFGLLQEGIAGITHSKRVVILSTSLFFSFSHFIAAIEGFTFTKTILAVVVSFFLGLIFSSLRLKKKSLIPGFLLHFSLYLLWNGPLFIR